MVDRSTPGSDNQLVSTICMFGSQIAFGDTANSTGELLSINVSPNLVDAALFIVSNGTYLEKEAPSCWQYSVDILQDAFSAVYNSNENAKINFSILIRAYAALYHIDLQLIVCDDNKYVLIDKNKFCEPDEQLCSAEEQAFIWCTNCNQCWPLYVNDINGRKLTVFKNGDTYVRCCVESFIDRVNEELHNSALTTAEEHFNANTNDLNHISIDDTNASTNETDSSIVLPSETGIAADAMIEQFISQIYRCYKPLLPTLKNMILGREVLDLGVTNLDRLSPQGSAELIQHRLLMISDIIQKAVEQTPLTIDTVISTELVAQETPALAETNITDNLVQTEQNTVNTGLPVTIYLSNTTPTPRSTPLTAFVTLQYDAPEIITQPNSEWNYRNMKEFEKKKLPFLAGEGLQRTPIRVKIGSQPSHPMYLAVQVQKHDNHEHPSKVLALKNTTVNMHGFCKDNNLSRLQFDQCNPEDHCDPTTRTVYLLITTDDYKAKAKDVQIHMFNLYQCDSITKEKIKNEQLHLCKLAFWFCIRDNGIYKSISPITLSNSIEEK